MTKTVWTVLQKRGNLEKVACETCPISTLHPQPAHQCNVMRSQGDFGGPHVLKIRAGSIKWHNFCTGPVKLPKYLDRLGFLISGRPPKPYTLNP